MHDLVRIMASTVYALVFLCLLAGHATAGSLDCDNSTPTGWNWYSNQSPSQIASIRSAGNRIVSIEVDSASPLRFTIATVPNSGSYYRPSRAFYYGTLSYVSSKLSGRRISCLAPYVINNQLYVAAAFVSNSGSHQKGWGWHFGTLSTVTSAIYKSKLRAIDIGTYVIGGKRYYSALGVSNSGADARSWWWYFGASSAYLASQLIANGGRYIDVHDAGNGLYNAIMCKGAKTPNGWHYTGVTQSYLVDKMSQNGARVISLQRVGSRYNACMINNSNELTTQLGELIRTAPCPSGFHLEELGGPVLASLNADRAFHPETSLTSLFHFHALREVRRRITLQTSTRIDHYYGNPNGCPNASQAKKKEQLIYVLASMARNQNKDSAFSIEQFFGRSSIGSTATLLGLSNTKLQHSIGCGAPSNTMTLRDAAKLMKAVELSSHLGSSKVDFYRPFQTLRFDSLVDGENARIGLPKMTLWRFKNLLVTAQFRGYRKIGSVELHSIVGLIQVPWFTGSRVDVRYFSYGAFLDRLPTSSSRQAFDRVEEGMLLALLRPALESWKGAKVPGSVQSFGAGCKGSNGILKQGWSGTPELGGTQNFLLRNAKPSGFAILQLGLSSAQWGPIPLPFDLKVVGAPGCTLLNEPLISFVRSTDAGGAASVAFKHPSTRDFINLSLYTQFLCIDAAANKLGLSYSNGLRTSIGGWRQ